MLLRRWALGAAVLLAWTADFGDSQEQISVAECEGKKIAILDLSELSAIGDFPKCHLDETVQVNVGNGIVYSKKHNISDAAPHMFGTHSAPWFLFEAIKSSKYYTTELEHADIIFVYDYCYYISWLGDVHSFGRDHLDGPGDSLFAAYSTMMETAAWKKYDGGNFAFYDPHPGFMAGKAAWAVQSMKCISFRNAIHIIVDTPMRNVCEGFWLIKKILVTPYVPNPLDMNHPEAYLQQPYIPLGQRANMAYSRARCHPYKPPSTNAGKLMRYWFSYVEWGANPEMDVRCTDSELNPQGHQEFKAMFDAMRHSKFCPAFPGDAASTRRLSEIFLAGCVPVFLGPPYHSMPFSETVPYQELGLFFNITNTSNWLINAQPEWQLHPTTRSVHETEARWWVPDADITSKLINVPSSKDVLPQLKAIPEAELERKLRLMHEYGTRFAFLQKLTQPPNAINSLMAGMCLKQTQFPPKLAEAKPAA